MTAFGRFVRKAAVLANVRLKAVAVGAPADLIAAVYENLVEASIKYELEQFDAG